MTQQASPKVSIIVPCYNAEKHLSECLDSILKQSLHDLEVIAVNDGSTDRTLDILHRYAAQDVRLRIIDQSNQGAPQARANGVKAACKTGSEAELARGFAGMHAYLRFSGILTIICLVVVVIALIAALVLGCSMGNCPAA